MSERRIRGSVERTRRRRRRVDVLLGVAYAALAVALVVGSVLAYDKAFTDSVDVTLEVDALGNALQEGSDVKVHGVPVGRVTSVEATSAGASVGLAISPEAAESLPADVTARLLPKTLFGERYVALDAPDRTTSAGLSSGDVIRQDTSREAVELEKVFDELLPVLKTLDPGKLSATLGELATTLRGNGKDIGDSMAAWGAYVRRLNPLVPTMTADIAKLADVAADYDAAVPDLLDALDSMTVTSHTLVDQQAELMDLYANVISSADTATGWVDDNQETIVVLSDESQAALDAVRPYASQFPCLFKAMRSFIPVMDKTLGKGTGKPGIRVRLDIVESRGKYLVGKDAVQYRQGGEARCPYVTGSGGRTPAGAPAAIPAPPNPRIQQQLADTGGLGIGSANSPGENQLIAELVAPTVGLAPAAYPDWGSLLVGPVLRGAEVSLR